MSYKILKVKFNEDSGLTINYTNLDGNKETTLKIKPQDIIKEFHVVWKALAIETRKIIDDIVNPEIGSVIVYGITLKPVEYKEANKYLGFVISCGFDIFKLRHNLNTPYYSLFENDEGETINYKTLRNLEALTEVIIDIIKGKRTQLDLINDTVLNEEITNMHG